MKYLPLSLFAFILLFINTLFAQQLQLLLPLPASGIILTSGPTAPVSSIGSKFELLDLTGDSAVLGYLPLSVASNERQAIIAPIAKQNWLASILSQQTISSFADISYSLLYILNDISVGRINTGNYVRIKATVYEKNSSGYLLLKKVDTLVTDNARTISSIESLINSAFRSTAALLNIRTGTSVPTTALTLGVIVNQEKEKYAFISNSINPTGIYMSYEQYKAQNPAYEQFFIKSDTTTKTVEINSLTNTDSTLRPVKPWAVAVNNELYLYQNKKLYPIETVGNNLVFSKFIDPNIRKNNGSFWYMAVGSGLSNKYGNIFDNLNTLLLNNYHGKQLSGEAIKVNSDSGTAEF